MKASTVLFFPLIWSLFFLFSFIVMSEAGVPHHPPSSSQQRRRSVLFLRLYLIRHGETESNVQNIVIGQSDSPLTLKGIEQARALGEHLLANNDCSPLSFWRIYSSDLQRAQHTTQLLVQKFPKQPPVRLDARLRELARGAREGLPKVLSEMQAFSERERLGMIEPISLLETLQEGWNRVADWLEEVMEDAVAIQEDNPDEEDGDSKVRNVLVITHSGLLRVFLERLVGVQRLQQHPDARFDKKNGVAVFSIPNSSLTILNIDVSNRTPEAFSGDNRSCTAEDAVQIEQLTNTEHFSRMQHEHQTVE